MDRFTALVNFQSAPESCSDNPADTRHNAAICSAHLPASSGPGQWQHPHNVTQWPVSCVPVSPLCLLCNLAAGQDQDGEPELGTQHRHRAPAGTQLGSPAIFLEFMG